MTDADAPTLRPKRYAIKFNPPRFVLEYTDGVKTRTRSVRPATTDPIDRSEKTRDVDLATAARRAAPRRPSRLPPSDAIPSSLPSPKRRRRSAC